jgi:hypothetical protein
METGQNCPYPPFSGIAPPKLILAPAAGSAKPAAEAGARVVQFQNWTRPSRRPILMLPAKNVTTKKGKASCRQQ